MLRETTILRNLQRLVRNIRAPGVPTVDELPDLAADWMVLLQDITDADMDAAVVAWIRESGPFWPTPGQLLALVPSRRAVQVDDAERAWAETKRWIETRSRAGIEGNGTMTGYTYRDPAPGDLDPNDEARDTAMREALGRGGAAEHMRGQVSDEQWRAKRFRDAYREGRKGGALQIEARTVALIATPPQKRIGPPTGPKVSP
jgi:hypothetical protein